MKKIEIPAPLIVVIDDVGWWSGFDGSDSNQPFRTGINRDHCPMDYEAVARLGNELKTQIITGFIWCEWDVNNLLQKIPSATWMGEYWDNPVKKKHLFEEAADRINQSLNHIEIGFHGLGHEFWENGIASRTEFHDSKGTMRNRAEIIRHFEVFEEISKISGIKTPSPKIFIPPALNHSFGNGNAGFQEILQKFGFSFVITAFDKARKYHQPLFQKFTKECGVTLIERGVSPVKWNAVAPAPCFSFDWPVLGLHWSNILHFNPEKNSRVVKKWAEYLISGAKEHGLVILPDAKDSLIQLIYSSLAEIRILEKAVIINLEKAHKLLPESPDNHLHVKTTISDKDKVKINGGKIISMEKYGPTETLIKITPGKDNYIELVRD